MADSDAYSFLAEWFDPQAELSRTFLLTYYVADGSLEMVDKKSLKSFLKRIKFPSIKPIDLFVGACISVYSRQIHLVDYANEYTRNLLKQRGSNTTFLIKPSGYSSLGHILSALEDSDLSLVKMRMIHIQPNDMSLLAKLVDVGHSSSNVQEWTRDFTIAIEVSVGSPSAVSNALQQLGRARDHVVVASQASPVFFDGNRFPTTAAMDDCSTLCLIRPRVVREGKCGAILDAILKAGFEISALKLVHVEVAAIDEFLAVYKPVTRQYHELVKYMSSAPLVAIEVRGDDIVSRFQAFCGPFDVQVARELAPTSLRARFGHTNIQNAVHCTDTPEDGALESQFFFRVLA
ncbi:hypothetical protein Ae201684_009205 [Aphanomyces euteiches]|uniref:DM10 domain-containing protein n=1 Tax=Aphanomyces euteiches TaxID=100861 RepID=A0A6G0X2E3_9STRA|nr:hypothetical protein Ae201684_009205 [Aphanomyces euteiches]